jgi:membrane-associated phospholipid phosphatase
LLLAMAVLFGSALVCTPARALETDETYVYRPEWRKFAAVDYVVTGAMITALATIEFTQSEPSHPIWTSPLPGELALRNAVVASSRDARERAALYSDWMWHSLVVYPFVDVFFTPLNRGGRLTPVWQMTMMNVQAFATAGLLVRMPQKWLGRTRPTVLGCEEDPDYAGQCKSTIRFVSFPGGHLAAAATGAGLTCAHHLHGKLYGGSGDVIACGTTLGAAAMVGYLRLYADEHWLSDQIVAASMGLFSGYVLPTVLYYHPFWRASSKPTKGAAPRAGALNWTITPQLTPDTLGLSLLLFE